MEDRSGGGAPAGAEIVLDIAGLGVLIYSPSSATHIGEGEDYLAERYWAAEDVQRHVQAGTVVAFATGSPGRFVLRLRDGYPSRGKLQAADFKLRLGLRCDGAVVFRDLYDLMDWTAEFPAEQSAQLAPGIYHLMLCSDRPASGTLGDNQVVDVYFQAVDDFPALASDGIATLCG